MPAAAVAAWIRSLEQRDVAVAAGPVVATQPFDVVEAACVAKAVASRRDEFHTGRRLARAALARLGCAPSAIPVGPSRAPIWPPGFVGSISHSKAECVVAAGRQVDYRSIGLDFERIVPLSPGVAAQICRAEELADAGPLAVMTRFVAKEALFKAYSPLTDAFLEFRDVRVDLDFERGRFTATLVDRDKPGIGGRRDFIGHFAQLHDHAAALLWIGA